MDCAYNNHVSWMPTITFAFQLSGWLVGWLVGGSVAVSMSLRMDT